jgi:hypothetical protein
MIRDKHNRRGQRLTVSGASAYPPFGVDVADWEIGHRVLQIWASCIGKSLAVVRSRCQEETGPGAPECARRRSGQHCPAGSGGSRWSGRQPDKPAGQRHVDGRVGSGFTRDWTAYELPPERGQLTARLGRRTGGRAWTVRRAAGGPAVLRCPAPANHRDPVTTNHLPGGKAESAAKAGTARLRRST